MGRASRACAQDMHMASLLGIDTNRVISFTFVLGATAHGGGQAQGARQQAGEIEACSGQLGFGEAGFLIRSSRVRSRVR